MKTTFYCIFDKISYGQSHVIRLYCGENRSRIAAAELDLWQLIAGGNGTAGSIKTTEEAVLYVKLKTRGGCTCFVLDTCSSFMQD